MPNGAAALSALNSVAWMRLKPELFSLLEKVSCGRRNQPVTPRNEIFE
jgi:hypothetical protein